MRRRRLIGSILTIILAGGGLWWGWDRDGSKEDGNQGQTRREGTTEASAIQQELLRLHNAERARYGLRPLRLNQTLNRVAQEHSEFQARIRDMRHEGAGGSSPWDRVQRAGYSYRWMSENVAFNQRTPAEAVGSWMTSDGHRRNILEHRAVECGFGMAQSNGKYWTAVFALPP